MAIEMEGKHGGWKQGTMHRGVIAFVASFVHGMCVKTFF
jgi:hypothetical protein